ncbi:hypothetical protein LPN01_06495 [Sphingomonas sp. A2-49]|uniref:hypothetical protein n=1 Tax=Sphingomonas sp. A2-49 TaxID=1391375 RepID=UPI0021CE5209|nr:hypothetical protein [Sphingomonas sp. A2-49]MCU6453721.1 hypothetical protein [Sphingomonas sp. A2-49]
MLIATIAAALVATVAPATADATAAPAPRIERPAANPRVCVVQRITGSMIPLRQCKSLADWRAEGIDPLARR